MTDRSPRCFASRRSRPRVASAPDAQGASTEDAKNGGWSAKAVLTTPIQPTLRWFTFSAPPHRTLHLLNGKVQAGQESDHYRSAARASSNGRSPARLCRESKSRIDPLRAVLDSSAKKTFKKSLA